MLFSNLIDKADLDVFLEKLKGIFSRTGHDHATLTIHDALGGDKEYNGTAPVDVQAIRGEDGFSPTVTVEEGDGKHTLTIKDKNGTQTVDIKDGKDAAGGEKIIKSLSITTNDIRDGYYNKTMMKAAPAPVVLVKGGDDSSAQSKFFLTTVTSAIDNAGGGSDGIYQAQSLHLQWYYGYIGANLYGPLENFNTSVNSKLSIPYVRCEPSEKGNTLLVEYIYTYPDKKEPSEKLKRETAEILSEDYIKQLISENSGGGNVVHNRSTSVSIMPPLTIAENFDKTTYWEREPIAINVNWHIEPIDTSSDYEMTCFTDTFVIPNSPSNVEGITFKTADYDGHSLSGTLSVDSSELKLTLSENGYNSEIRCCIDRITVD